MEGITNGYPGLAKVMGQFDDLALYRRFSELNAHNLLYMQAEIMLLERELWALGYVDQHSGDVDREAYSQHAEKMIQSSRGDGSAQWDKIVEIRGKLRVYNDALLQQSAMKKLPKARKQDLDVLQDWLRRPEGGDNFLQSFEDRPWGDNKDDLAGLGNGVGTDADLVTRWTANTALPWLHNHGLHRFKASPPDK